MPTCPLVLAASGDNVWAGLGERTSFIPRAAKLSRLDPATGASTGRTFDVPEFEDMAVGADAVWLLSDKLFKVDPASGSVVGTYDYGGVFRSFVAAPD